MSMVATSISTGHWHEAIAVDLKSFELLLSESGRSALAAAHELAPTEATLLGAGKRLQKRFDRSLVRAALQMVLLRQQARAKFPQADRMYFTREALEQASGHLIAQHRARRFADYGVVGDLCCGIGGDTLALAERGPVVAVDADPLRLAMARANLGVCRPGALADFLLGDALTVHLPPLRAIFADPDRRANGRRRLQPQRYQPPLDALLARFPPGFPIGVKLAPAVDWKDVASYPAEVEFLSVDGELKECVLWFGPLRTLRRRATVLPANVSLAAQEPAAPTGGLIAGFLYDPDPAVTRAGLVADLALQLKAHQIDPALAFLCSERYTPTPLARAYRIDDAFPFQLKRLRQYFREHQIGAVTVVKRGSAVDVNDLKRQLRLRGDLARTLFLSRINGEPFAIVGESVK